MPERCRVVDARYLSPDIPAETPPRFAVDGAHVVPANDLPRAGARQPASSSSARARPRPTASSGCCGTASTPTPICWVRPREPWMLDRANIQPDPVVYLGMVAELMRLASTAPALPELFAAARGRRDR